MENKFSYNFAMNLLSRELINQGKTVNRSEVIDRYGKRRTDRKYNQTCK